MGNSMLDINTGQREQIIAQQKERRQRAKKYCGILKRNIDNIIAFRKVSKELDKSLQSLTADAIDSLYILSISAEAAIKDIQAALLTEISRRKAEG